MDNTKWEQALTIIREAAQEELFRPTGTTYEEVTEQQEQLIEFWEDSAAGRALLELFDKLVLQEFLKFKGTVTTYTDLNKQHAIDTIKSYLQPSEGIHYSTCPEGCCS